MADGEGFAPPSAFAQPVFGTGAFAARPPIRGGTCGTRTRDLRIRNPTLYPLSYDAFWRRMQDLHLRDAFAPYGLATRRIRLLCQSSVAPPLKGGVACLPPAHDSLRSIERLPTRRMKNGHRAFDAQRPSSTDMKKRTCGALLPLKSLVYTISGKFLPFVTLRGSHIFHT